MAIHKGYYNIRVAVNKTPQKIVADAAQMMLELDKTHEKFKQSLIEDSSLSAVAINRKYDLAPSE